MPRRGKSECVAEGLSQQVGVKIARHGRTDKRTSTVLVVILLVLSASLCPDIDAQVRPGLRVGIGLLQNVDGSAQGRPRARRIGSSGSGNGLPCVATCGQTRC